jgi:hypothetical protein
MIAGHSNAESQSVSEMSAQQLSGIIAGYDPGGNDRHGLALAEVKEGRCVDLNTRTLKHAKAVGAALEDIGDLRAAGIDTLAAWATGPSGWRAADL